MTVLLRLKGKQEAGRVSAEVNHRCKGLEVSAAVVFENSRKVRVG